MRHTFTSCQNPHPVAVIAILTKSSVLAVNPPKFMNLMRRTRTVTVTITSVRRGRNTNCMQGVSSDRKHRLHPSLLRTDNLRQRQLHLHNVSIAPRTRISILPAPRRNKKKKGPTYRFECSSLATDFTISFPWC